MVAVSMVLTLALALYPFTPCHTDPNPDSNRVTLPNVTLALSLALVLTATQLHNPNPRQVLQKLVLGANSIGDEGASAIAEALYRIPYSHPLPRPTDY